MIFKIFLSHFYFCIQISRFISFFRFSEIISIFITMVVIRRATVDFKWSSFGQFIGSFSHGPHNELIKTKAFEIHTCTSGNHHCDENCSISQNWIIIKAYDSDYSSSSNMTIVVPASMNWSGLTKTSLTFPVFGDLIMFSIFIASRMTRTSP